MVNTDEKYEFKLLAMLESSQVKSSSPTFNDTKLLVPLRLRLTSFQKGLESPLRLRSEAMLFM